MLTQTYLTLMKMNYWFSKTRFSSLMLVLLQGYEEGKLSNDSASLVTSDLIHNFTGLNQSVLPQLHSFFSQIKSH